MRVKQPLEDICIIRPYKKIQSAGGILIPREADDFHEDIGKIVYCGPGLDGKTMHVGEGDWVLFSTHGHQVVKIDGEELIVLRQPSIVCTLDPSDADLKALEAPEFKPVILHAVDLVA